MVEKVESGIAVTVFFDEGLAEERMKEIGQNIEKRKEVDHVVYVSAEEAWKNFSNVYFEGNEEFAEGFSENPLANSSNYEVYINDVSKQSSLVAYIENVDGVREVRQSQAVAETLTEFNNILYVVSGGVILILLFVSMFLIKNTVTTGINVRKEEISIMRLVGASNFLIRTPFVVEGLIIGAVGAAMPLALLFVLYDKILIHAASKFEFLAELMEFIPSAVLFKQLIPIGLILGVGIGFLGSRGTVKKYLKV
jgi:cell division transport system permease protein